jgi:TolB protein
MRLRSSLLAVAALAVVAGGAVATPTLATAPGTNGSITFRRYLGPDRTQGAIFVAAPDGTGEKQLTTPPANGGDDYPDFASDGSFVAFQRCRDACTLYTVRPDGSGLTQLGPTGRCTKGKPDRCDDSSYVAIAPDRKRVAFVHAYGAIRKDTIDHVGISVMRLDGTHVRQVTLPPSRVAEDDQPQFSPDRRRIVFTRLKLKTGLRAVYTVDADGRHVHRITAWKLNGGDGPDWSPDGTQILFRAPESDDFLNSDLYTIHPDGTGLRQLTHLATGTKLYSASFSPDGTAITFGMSGTDGAADVFTMKVDGTGVAPVTRTPQWDSAPDWGGAQGM